MQGNTVAVKAMGKKTKDNSSHLTCKERMRGSSWASLAVGCVGCFAVNDYSGVTRESNLQVSCKSHLILKSRSNILEREVFVLLLNC